MHMLRLIVGGGVRALVVSELERTESFCEELDVISVLLLALTLPNLSLSRCLQTLSTQFSFDLASFVSIFVVDDFCIVHGSQRPLNGRLTTEIALT